MLERYFVTYKKLTYLLLFFISVLLIALLVPRMDVRAQDFSWHAAGYAIVNTSPGMGYALGVGGLGELYGRWKFLEVKASGTIRNQHKKHAQSGYTYGYGVQGRGYVWRDFYLLGGSNWAGYRSEFESGAVWEKKGQNYGIGAGYNNGDTDINLAYYFKEHESPNQVQYTSLSLRQRIYGYLHGLYGLTYQTYDQMTSTGMERWNGFSMTIGLGVKF